MKKISLLLLTILSFASNAQEMKYGAKIGLNISSFKGDSDANKTLKGPQIGGILEIKLIEKFYIQPEILFSMQGARMEYGETDQNDYYEERVKAKLNYLNIPVSIKYNVYDKFTLLAGPQIGMLLSAKEEYNYRGSFNGVIESISENSNIKNNLNPIAFSFNLGASYGFLDNFFIDARYNIGLSNISKMEDDFGDTINLKNNVIQFSLGYLF